MGGGRGEYGTAPAAGVHRGHPPRVSAEQGTDHSVARTPARSPSPFAALSAAATPLAFQMPPPLPGLLPRPPAAHDGPTAQNNHEGGFIRVTLVPWGKRFSGFRHARNAFYHACWAAGIRRCRPATEPCGTDKGKPPRAHTQKVTIPAAFPDGDYALGWAWYGGWPQMGDYYSCSRVRVRGGQGVAPVAPVKAVLGKGGTCAATVGRLSVCIREPCARKLLRQTQLAGWPGRLPKQVRRDRVMT